MEIGDQANTVEKIWEKEKKKKQSQLSKIKRRQLGITLPKSHIWEQPLPGSHVAVQFPSSFLFGFFGGCYFTFCWGF